MVIWTTTPWTLPANQAVTVHPEMEYVTGQTEGRAKLLLAEPALASAVALRP